MMTLGYSTYIWVRWHDSDLHLLADGQIPLFTFPTVESPRFPKGYPASVAFDVALWSIVMFGFWFMARRSRRLDDRELDAQTLESPGASVLEEKEDEEPRQADQASEAVLGVERQPLPLRSQ
jgi:hypothetical protein